MFIIKRRDSPLYLVLFVFKALKDETPLVFGILGGAAAAGGGARREGAGDWRQGCHID